MSYHIEKPSLCMCLGIKLRSLSAEPNHAHVAMLKTENDLLEIDHGIKTALQLASADPDKCIRLFKAYRELTLTPLMLLKNPTCVETIKRLRRYVGNIKNWAFNEAQAVEFLRKSEKIRREAIEIYNQFKVSARCAVQYD